MAEELLINVNPFETRVALLLAGAACSVNRQATGSGSPGSAGAAGVGSVDSGATGGVGGASGSGGFLLAELLIKIRFFNLNAINQADSHLLWD